MLEIPSAYDILNYLDFLRGFPSLYLVLLSSMTILITKNWRWSLLALFFQYQVVGLVFADVMLPQNAFMKVVIGTFSCFVLFATAGQTNWGGLPKDVTPREAVVLSESRILRFGPYMLPTDTSFRIFFGLFILLSVWTVSKSLAITLLNVPSHVALTFSALIIVGLITSCLTSEPYKAGIGILTFVSGFELFYSSFVQTIGALAIFALVNLVITLIIAYLTQARHSFPSLLD